MTQGSQSADPGHVAIPEDAPDTPTDTALPADHVPLAARQPGLPLLPEAATQIDRAAPPPSPRRTEIARLSALATASFEAKDYIAAADPLAQILKLDPDSPAAHGNLAVALWRTKHMARAEALCRRALALNPDYVPAHRLVAELLRERRDVAGALAAYDRLLQLDPENVISHNNAGLMLRAAGRFEEAEAHFARALVLTPGDPSIRFNQLASRRDDEGLDEAIECCRRSLEQTPDSSDVLTNLGVTLLFAGRFDEALACIERAVALDPDNHQAHFNLAALLLLRGDFARGWGEYESRWHVAAVKKPEYRQPQWEGEDLAGKTILLQSEQGFGDTVQCLRYLPAVAARAGRVLLRTERGLVRLAASLPSNPMIFPPHVAIPPFDVWCPLLSLPRVFGTEPHTIPADMPYLRPRPALAARWQRRLGSLAGLKVGMAWAGSEKHANDFRRSIGLERLKPLLDVPGVSFVSLQVGPPAAEIAALPPGTIVDLSAQLTDFAETAGAILNLDLVIAVDTAVVHLGGALARPAWVMLPFSPDWRWMIERDDSPWYPTLRLYRQPTPGDWDSVIRRVRAELAALVADLTAGPRRP